MNNLKKDNKDFLSIIEEFASSASIGIFLVKPSGELFFYNRALEDLFYSGSSNLKSKQGLGSLRKFIKEADQLIDLINQILDKNIPITGNYSFFRHKNKPINVVITLQNANSANNPVIVGYVHPLIQGMPKTNYIKELGIQLHDVISNLDDFFYIKDFNGSVVIANDAFYRIMKVSNVDEINKLNKSARVNPLFDLLHDKDLKFINKVRKRGNTGILTEQESDDNYSFRRIALINETFEYLLVYGNNYDDLKVFENTLFDNQSSLRAILEATPNCISLIDRNMNLVQVNSKYIEFVNDFYDKKVSIGQSALEFLTREEKVKWKSIYEKAFSGLTLNDEIRLQRGGFDFYFEYSIMPAYDLTNQIIGLSVHISDITERKLAEDIIKESEVRFRQLAENTNDAFILSNEKSIIYVNPAFEKLTGTDQSFALSGPKIIEKYLHDEDRKRFLKNKNMSLRNDEVNFQEQQYRLIDSSGKKHLVWIRNYPIFNTKHDPYRSLTVISDLTEQVELEHAISNSHLQQKAILDNIPYLAWLKDSEGRYVLVNDAFSKFFQLKTDQIIGKTDREIFPEKTIIKHELYDKEVREARKRKLKEDLWATAEGNRWVETFTAPILADNDALIGITGIARDISDRKAMEETIIKNEEHFRALLQYSSDAITILDKDGMVVFESSLRNRISDFMIDELIDKPYQTIIHPDDVHIFIEILNEVKKKPETQIKKEFRSLHKNKKWIYVESIFSNHLNNPSIKGIVVNTRDVSDRKMSELKERVYHDNLIFLSNSALDLLGLSDRGDIFRFIGDKLHGFLEDAIVLVAAYSEDDKKYRIEYVSGISNSFNKIVEFIGMDPVGLEYASSELPENFDNTGNITTYKDPVKELNLSGLKSAAIEAALLMLKVNKIYNISMIRDNKVLGIITILTLNKTIIKFKHIIETFVHQVSVALHRSQLEFELVKAKIKAEESDMLKTAFLANMSHEIRTPMNGILGFAEMLNDENISEGNRKKYVEIINNNGKMLMSLIDDIIDFAKIEAGQIKILKQEFSLNSLLTQVHSSFLSESLLKKEKTKVKLRIRKAFPNEECFVQTDPNRLRQILTNLVGNAFKFTQEGYIEFGYSLPKNGFIEFYVKDTGIGIADDKIDLIFDRFVQADYSRSRKYSGSGLGLAISKGFVELLGGKMWAKSKVREGSTFFFTIPYIPAATRTLEESERTHPRSDYNWEDKCFLIAEDDKFSFKLLEGFLRKTNAKILHAEDGIKAVDICKSGTKVDLILMDVQMPEMNGMEATRIIKGFKAELPIIAQTANAIAEERQRCFEAGFDDFITKPINISELFTKIDKWLITK